MYDWMLKNAGEGGCSDQKGDCTGIRGSIANTSSEELNKTAGNDFDEEMNEYIGQVVTKVMSDITSESWPCTRSTNRKTARLSAGLYLSARS